MKTFRAMLAETYCGTSTRDRAVPRTTLMARVLIVRGHARSGADTAATLRAEGHEVLEAGSADTGVRLAHEQGPEVILLDPMLPDRSGYELCASLQRDRGRPPPAGLRRPAARVWPRRRHRGPPRGRGLPAAPPRHQARRRTTVIGSALGPDGPTLTASLGVAEPPRGTWRDLLDRTEAALTRANEPAATAARSGEIGVELGKVVLRHRPHEVDIDIEVPVDQHVPHRDHLPPWHLGMSLARRLGQPARGLSDDLDPADHRGLDELVVGEGGAAPGGLLYASMMS
jgi:hypothetical protein